MLKKMRFKLVGGKDKEYVRHNIDVVDQFWLVDVWIDYKDTLLGNVWSIQKGAIHLVAATVYGCMSRCYKVPATVYHDQLSFNTILERYRTHVEANSGNSNDHQPEKHQQECRTPCENNNILPSVQRFFESQAVEQLDISLLSRLEHFLDAKLAQTRSRKVSSSVLKLDPEFLESY
ncbi:hypothetical protein TEA_010487 [Camellia sinensis var. sinensis]|uniref:Uncharacterized protein n=1 Tax=Camellia sinensis var. sinensis TaxID=542762 RepID=A0A4S4D5E6_CAMSN|nr:hypothetical protein TEA_010487 [Camellia sinensis var. sinensis]